MSQTSQPPRRDLFELERELRARAAVTIRKHKPEPPATQPKILKRPAMLGADLLGLDDTGGH